MRFHSKYINNMNNNNLVLGVVDEMVADKVNSKPFDFLFRRNSEAYPKTSHITLGLPGIFKSVETSNAFTFNGKALQQDFVETVLPDGELIIEESVLSVEHLSYILTLDKIHILYNYKTSTTFNHGKPCIPVIVTNIDYKTDELICKINDDTFSVKVIYFSPEKIAEILNTLSKKDYSKEELSEADFLNLVHCLIFAQKDDAKEVVEKVANIFVTIKNIKQKYQLDLHLALKIMIKYRFSDENEVRRLLLMITQAISEENLERLSSYEYLVERAEKSNQLEKALEEKDKALGEMDLVLEEKDKALGEMDLVLEEKDKALGEMDLALEEKDAALAEIKEENRKLKEKLAFYGK